MCEETRCDWKCKKPTLCPKPKCELQCERPACQDVSSYSSSVPRTNNNIGGCCHCNEITLGYGMRLAEKNPASHTFGDQPTLIELVNENKHKKNQGEETCCPCTSP